MSSRAVHRGLVSDRRHGKVRFYDRDGFYIQTAALTTVKGFIVSENDAEAPPEQGARRSRAL
jgi:hypothetical protein